MNHKRLLLALPVGIGLLLAQAPTIGPTKPMASQLAEPSLPYISVRVIMPNGIPAYAKLDLGDWVLDTTVNPPVLKARVSTVPPADPSLFDVEATRVEPLKWSIGFKPSKVQDVHRNGILMREGRDYAISEGVITVTPGQGDSLGDSWVVRGSR